jgi:hypothetical protein
MLKSKFKNLAEWKAYDNKAYLAAYKNGVLSEICEMFNITKMTLYDWRNKNKIRYEKISPRCVRYYLPDWYQPNPNQ